MKNAINDTPFDRFSAKLNTHVFRQKLTKHGVMGADSYQWHNGEALYMGDPIAGRANVAEAKAIAEMQSLFNTHP